MHFCRRRVLPLEAGRLFSVAVGVILDCFEHTRAKLGAQTSQRSFLLKVLDYNILQIVHFKFIYILFDLI